MYFICRLLYCLWCVEEVNWAVYPCHGIWFHGLYAPVTHYNQLLQHLSWIYPNALNMFLVRFKNTVPNTYIFCGWLSTLHVFVCFHSTWNVIKRAVRVYSISQTLIAQHYRYPLMIKIFFGRGREGVILEFLVDSWFSSVYWEHLLIAARKFEC